MSFDRLAYQTLRKEKHITHKELADRGVSSERYISMLENGARDKPSLGFLLRNSLVLHEPLYKFVSLSEPQERKMWASCTCSRNCTCPYANLHMACVLYVLLFPEQGAR